MKNELCSYRRYREPLDTMRALTRSLCSTIVKLEPNSENGITKPTTLPMHWMTLLYSCLGFVVRAFLVGGWGLGVPLQVRETERARH